MEKLKEHAVKAGKAFNCGLQKRVHPASSWMAIAAATVTSFFIINLVLAETGSINDPFATTTPALPIGNEIQPPLPPAGSGTTTCVAGTACNNKQVTPIAPQNMGGQNNMMPNSPMQAGPSEEDVQKMDEQRFQMMKKGYNKFLVEMKRVKNQVNLYKKKGVTIPEELQSAIDNINSISEKIKLAQNADELDEVMGEYEDSIDIIREWMPKLPRLAVLPKMTKQADKEVNRALKIYISLEKKVTSSKLEFGNQLAEFKADIEKQSILLAEIKIISKTDPEDALDKLQDEFFPDLDNMWEKQKVIETALNIRKGIGQMALEIKNSQKIIITLKKKKIETSELEGLIKTAKSQLEEIKKLAAAKPIDTDAAIEAVDNLMETKQAFNDKVQELTGETGYTAPTPALGNFKFNLPQGYQFENNNQGAISPPQTCNINGVEVPGKCEDLENK